GRGIAPHSPSRKVREPGVVPRRAGVVILQTEVRRGKAQGQGDIEWLKGVHHAVKPFDRIWAKRVRPAQSGSHVANTMRFHPLNGLIEPGIFKMEPLAEADGAVGRKVLGSKL